MILVLCSLLSLISGVPVALAGQPSAPRVIQIIVGDHMKFDPATISARPGERLRVVLKDVGTMPKVAMGHNFVLLVKGANAKEVVDTCAPARATEFIAEEVKPKLIAFTKLVGPGETAEAQFTAPKQPGDYVYLCSFPGHFAMGMKGILTVK